MTGPEHYRAAEQLLADAETSIELDQSHYLLAAQVHATLAATAATIDAQEIATHAYWRTVLR